jgi:hypothetical protein
MSTFLIRRNLVESFFQNVRRATLNDLKFFLNDDPELITALAQLTRKKVIRKVEDNLFELIR